MTECDVVRRAGATNQGQYRGERARRAGGDDDLQPGTVAGRLPFHRRAADLDRASQRAAGFGEGPKIRTRAQVSPRVPDHRRVLRRQNQAIANQAIANQAMSGLDRGARFQPFFLRAG